MINRLFFKLIVLGLVLSQPYAFPNFQPHADPLWPPTFSSLFGTMHLRPMQTLKRLNLGYKNAVNNCALALRIQLSN